MTDFQDSTKTLASIIADMDDPLGVLERRILALMHICPDGAACEGMAQVAADAHDSLIEVREIWDRAFALSRPEAA